MDYQDIPKIGDIKTTSKKWPEDRIKKEIQPIFYSYAHEKERGVRPEFDYDILIARRNNSGEPTSEDHQRQSIKASDNDYRALFAKLEAFIKVIKTGAFLPADSTSWICSPQWCGYYPTCIYQGNKPAKM